jgi:CRP-like cAMP-binding protein
MDQDMSDFLFSTLGRYTEIPETEKDFTQKLTLVQSLKPNEDLVRQGESWGRVGVVYSGVLRVFTDTGGNDRIVNFRIKGDVTGVYAPYFMSTGKKTWFSIQALTECTILSLTPQSYQTLIARHPAWQKIENSVFFDHYLEMENRVRSLLIDDAETRYLKFQKDYPGLEQQISLYHIACYLGISPVSLSRIRRKLCNESRVLQ